jgi:hypothetical protein
MNEPRVSTRSTLIQYAFGFHSQRNNEGRRNIGDSNKEGRNKIVSI